MGGQVETGEREPGSIRDRYGRELVYLRTRDGRDGGRRMIRDGFVHAYTRFPSGRVEDHRAAGREPRELKVGLWADDPTPKR